MNETGGSSLPRDDTSRLIVQIQARFILGSTTMLRITHPWRFLKYTDRLEGCDKKKGDDAHSKTAPAFTPPALCQSGRVER